MFKPDANVLLDTHEEHGNTFEGMKEVVDAFRRITKFMKWHSADIELLSYKCRDKMPVDEKDKDGNTVTKKVPVVSSYLLTPNNLPSHNPDYRLSDFVKAYREKSVKSKELLKEWTEDVKLAFVFNNNSALPNEPKKSFYFASSNALQTMDRFGLSGEFLLEPSLNRDQLIAERFGKDLGVTVIVREVDGAKKVFSILSDKYTHIDQGILFDIVKEIEEAGEMGEAKCHEWRINNFFTKLYIEFPEKAKELSKLYGLKREMIPGILMTTSDTGDSSFKVCGTWRVEGTNSLVVHSDVKRKHIGDIKTEKILEDITNKIFAEYARLPEALCNLMAHDVTDASWDLTTTAGLKANYAEIESTLKTAFNRLGIVKAIGKKMEKKLREAMMNEFDVSIRYTAYDIAMSILGLPERAVFMDKDKDISELQKACANAPFISYKVDSSVVLTA